MMEDDDSKNSSKNDSSNESESDSDSGSSSDSKSGSGSSSSDSSKSEDDKSAASKGSDASDQGEDEDVNIDNESDAHSSSFEQGKRGSRVDDIKKIVRSAHVMRKEAAEKPDLYGIRRSNRQRKEVERYDAAGSESDEAPRRSGRGAQQRSSRKNSSNWGSSSSGDSEDNTAYKPRGATKSKRTPGRRAPRRAATRKAPSRSSNRSTRVRRLSESGTESSSSSSTDSSSSDEEHPSRISNRRPAGSKKVSTPVAKKGKSKSRISKRKVTDKKMSYKEDSDNKTDSEDLIEYDVSTAPPAEINNAETIEKVLHHRVGRVGATGSKTTLYNVQDNGDPNSIEGGEDAPTELQYLIKWKGWSHMHNTWESDSTLQEQKVNGMKKMENYLKREEELSEWREVANPEDIEYYSCQQEMMEDLLVSYRRVDRIITHKGGTNNYPEYFVLWRGLPYAESTWEDGELIQRRFPDAVEQYELRNKSQKIPTKICRALKLRPKFTPFKEQPTYVGGEDHLQLRDYQKEGLNWLMHSWSKQNSAILADEMGLGKTIETISFISVLMNAYHVYGPFLMVVPLSTIVTWQREFKTWAPDINCVVYLGDINSRSIIRESEWCHSGNKRLKFNVLITTYEIVLKDKSFLGGVSWAMLGVDEAHRLKNDDSLLYKCLFQFDTNHRLLITGTPLQNTLKELWALLHFIMPEKFDSWADFESRHSMADKTGFAQLHKELEPFLLRRVKKDVEKSLPAKVEQILRVEMSKIQKQYYKWILTKNYKALSKGLKNSPSSFINIIMELKKCCNHAHLIRLPENVDWAKDDLELLIKGSGKLILLDKLLMRLKESGHRVLIFSQMVRMLDIVAEYLQLRRFNYQRLDGSIRGELRRQAMDHFNAEDSVDFCFLLSTRAGGLGVNLATADTVIIFDSDWNPQNDLQAQARAHRIGQKNQVSVYRFVTKNSIEEDIVERAKKKMVLDHLVIQRMDTTGRTVLSKGGAFNSSRVNNPFNKEELNAILKFGAEALFKEEQEDEEVQVDIDEILKLAETRENEDDQKDVKDELLSQFKVVSFDNLEDEEIERPNGNDGKHWDDIIPENDRRKIEDEELQQQLSELNLPPRSRKQIKNLSFDSDDDYAKKAKKDDESFSSEDDSDDDRPKKRGRPKHGREGIKGFNIAEIRRFVRSFKKFGRPMERLDSIAGDAELMEKSSADLARLGEMLQSQCQQSMTEYEEKQKEDPEIEVGKKVNRGPTFKLSSVSVNAKSVIQASAELEPLSTVMPVNKDDRKKFVIDFHIKNAHFDCPWDPEDDARLLWGIYECGMGNWEAIKMDPDFDLHDKILPDGDLKPQAKQLQTRCEYLLKALAKHLGQPVDQVTVQRKEKQRQAAQAAKKKAAAAAAAAKSGKKFKSKEIIDDPDSDNSDRDRSTPRASREKEDAPGSPKKKKKKKKDKEKQREVIEEEEEEEEEGELREHVKEKKKKRKKKPKQQPKSGGPVHITVGETKLITGGGQMPSELPAEVFAKCKDKMRPVKKSLKALASPDPDLSDKEQLQHTRKCLLKIGDHIHHCLSGFNDPDVIKEWRSFLWMFVSEFTVFDAVKLHKVYKHAVKKRDGERDLEKEKPQAHDHKKEQPSQSSQYHKQQTSHGYHGHTQKRPHHDDQLSRPDDKNKDPHRALKRSQPETWSDNSRDSGYRVPDGRGDADGNHDSNSSERWKLFSPLARQDEAPRKRYDSFNSYSRPPNQYGDKRSQHHPDKSFHGNKPYGDKQRYNNDRREGASSHFQRDQHANYSTTFNRFDPRDRGDGQRGYRQDFGDRKSEHGMYGQRPGDQERLFGNGGDRKRKSNDRDWATGQNDPRRNPKESKLYQSPVDERGDHAHIPTIISPGGPSSPDTHTQHYMH